MISNCYIILPINVNVHPFYPFIHHLQWHFFLFIIINIMIPPIPSSHDSISLSLSFKQLIGSQLNPYFIKGLIKLGHNTKLMKFISKTHKA